MLYETYVHECRVSLLARYVGHKLDLDVDYVEDIVRAAELHDIGKEIIPDEIISKPGKLTPEEYDVIKTHCINGYTILNNQSQHVITQMVALQHHERWDGSGYPYGLKGDQIILPARIVALCDVYEAIRSKRIYKPQYSHEETMEILYREQHKYDPMVWDAFHAIEISDLDYCFLNCTKKD